ncbi:MAG TPA: DinB family protein [Gemmatimonadaceae bacterium]
MARPKSDFDALREDLRKVYDGDPWHGPSITDVLKGVDADTAALRSIPRGHTIWEIVLHMTAWTREVASRVCGANPKPPPEDWPAPKSGGGEASWRSTQDDLATAQQELERAVDALKPDDLLRWIGDQRDPTLGTGLTVGTLIRGLLQHHTYHEGQIALLKRAADTAPGTSLFPNTCESSL